jgi:transcriptional regulator with XRE-family HTH domain
MVTFDERLGKQIKIELVKRGITQKDMSEMISISPQSLSLSLKGQRRISAETLALIARQLECTMDYIVAEAEKLNESDITERYSEIKRVFEMERKRK